jgi:hypothetical protein
LVFLLAALVAMTVIDARTFQIPIKIPIVIIVVAFVANAVQALLPQHYQARGMWPIPATGWPWFAAACGGMLGVTASLILLRLGVFRYSYADYDEFLEEGQTFAEYPHDRREMGVEMLFLTPCLAGIVAGYYVGQAAGTGPPPLVSRRRRNRVGGACSRHARLWPGGNGPRRRSPHGGRRRRPGMG